MYGASAPRHEITVSAHVRGASAPRHGITVSAHVPGPSAPLDEITVSAPAMIAILRTKRRSRCRFVRRTAIMPPPGGPGYWDKRHIIGSAGGTPRRGLGSAG